MPAPIVRLPDRKMNRPYSLKSLYGSMQTGLLVLNSTMALLFFNKIRGFFLTTSLLLSINEHNLEIRATSLRQTEYKITEKP